MSLVDIIRRRQRAIISAWKTNPLILVMTEDLQQLPGIVFPEDRSENAGVARAGRRREGSVGILQGPGDPDFNASVWVRADYSGYQGAYLTFIKQVYDVSASKSDLAGYNIDHLLNRARSPGGAGYIRIEAVQADVNQRWGSLFERAAGFDTRRLRRSMDWTICSKLAGLMPPRGPDDTDGINRLVTFYKSIGLTEQEARQGLIQRFQFGYRGR